MQWTSLFAHNVLEPDTAAWSTALSLDVIATGLSASNIIMGKMVLEGPFVCTRSIAPLTNHEQNDRANSFRGIE